VAFAYIAALMTAAKSRPATFTGSAQVFSGAEAVRLSSMTPEQVRPLVELARIVRRDCRVEFSDGSTLDNVRAFDLISPVESTHSATAAPMRLLVDSLE